MFPYEYNEMTDKGANGLNPLGLCCIRCEEARLMELDGSKTHAYTPDLPTVEQGNTRAQTEKVALVLSSTLSSPTCGACGGEFGSGEFILISVELSNLFLTFF